jgi:hypothetical protein
MEELAKATGMLPSRKSGVDIILAEVIKSVKEGLIEPLYKLLTKCWEEGAMPQDMHDANIVTLYKTKGDRSICNKYQGISFISIVSKLFAQVVLHRLQQSELTGFFH